MGPAVVILAHQGGWDEALMALAPVVLFWLLLRAAKARSRDAEPDPPSGSPPSAQEPHATTPADVDRVGSLHR